MTFSHIHRRTATALTAAMALATAGPAAAQPLGWDGPIPVAPPTPAHYDKANVLPPFVPKHVKAFPETTAAPVATATPRAVVNHPAAGGSDLIYVLAGGVVFAVGGLGGTLVASRRRAIATGAGPRPRIAA